jgi:ketosteroid isomerase-like protein
MSNRQTAEEGYAAFSRGDLDTALGLLADDVEWIVPGTSGISGSFHGTEEVLRLWERLAERDWRVQPEYWFVDEDHVCALCHVTLAGGEMDTADLLTFQGGRVQKFQTAVDTELLSRVWPPE